MVWYQRQRRIWARVAVSDNVDANVLSRVVHVCARRYHLFGNTVNLAMAMESNGIPGKVHISSEAYQWLQHRLRDAKEHPEVGGLRRRRCSCLSSLEPVCMVRLPAHPQNHKAFRKLAGDIEFAFEPREPMHILGHDDVQT